MVRFDTLTTGAAVAEVVFELNGKPLFTKRTPPWSVELDLGSLPRTHTLRVRSLDSAGKELASDELLVNAGAHRFKARLLEPRRGGRYSESLRAEAQVETPEGQGVERVEFYLNEDRVATLYQPPWTQAIVLPPGEPVAYVVFINAPDYLEEVDVQFVELYTTVVDRAGHAVSGLGKQDFQVFEDGAEQQVLRFELVENLPVHAGVLLDISASMETRLPKVQAAALRFFETAITSKDRAALITFNDRPSLAVRLSNDAEILAGGLAGLKAERGTALWDSLIFALYYFNGIKGQRALVVLSDGEDENSRFAYEDTLDYARRSGVAIYTIGVEMSKASRDARRKLARLAEETGGRSFFIESIDELASVYEQVQRELRSRYLVAYQSANASGSDKFRTVDVKLRRSGLEAKTLRGYYP
jgi:VWFA-related protein